MINVIVSYTVQPGFVESNKNNIRLFLKDFQELDTHHFSYEVLLKEDGVTFVHISSYENKDIQQQILNVPSFLEFQRKRDESGLNDSHKVAVMEFIGSSNSQWPIANSQ